MATTKTTTAKRSTAKRSTAKQSTAKKTTRKTTAKRAPKRVPLTEREPKVVLEDAGYAIAGVADDVVAFARTLPAKLESYRAQLERNAEQAPDKVKSLRSEAPVKVRASVEDVRGRLTKDVDTFLRGFEQRFDAKAAEGRKVTEQVKHDERVEKMLAQHETTIAQLKGALTSVTKTATVTFGAASEAGRKQAENAITQLKAAATSLRRSGETVAEAATDTAEQAAS